MRNCAWICMWQARNEQRRVAYSPPLPHSVRKSCKTSPILANGCLCVRVSFDCSIDHPLPWVIFATHANPHKVTCTRCAQCAKKSVKPSARCLSYYGRIFVCRCKNPIKPTQVYDLRTLCEQIFRDRVVSAIRSIQTHAHFYIIRQKSAYGGTCAENARAQRNTHTHR